MRHHRFIALSAAPLLALAACTAIAGLDGDFEVGSPDGAASSSGNPDVNTSSSSSSSSGGPDVNTSSSSSSSSGDTGAPDTGPEYDAKPPTPYASAAATCVFDASSTRFCWDFDMDAAPDSTTLNLNELNLSNGSVLLNDAAPTTPQRAAIATAGQTAQMVWKSWGSPAATTPLKMAPTQLLDFHFVFIIRKAGAYGVIGALRLDDVSFGLAIHPKGCGKDSDCLGEINRGGTFDSVHGATFLPNTRYLAHVIAQRTDYGPWSGTIMVGDRVVATRSSGVFDQDAGLTPMRVEFGVFEAAGVADTVQVEVDEIYLEMSPKPAQ